MIPSENHTSPAVLEALGSILTDKYAEGYPGRRYYGGNQIIDQVETLAVERAKQAFGVPYANMQPYSGSPANFSVYLAVCENGDTIMGQSLFDGGHLTHGWKTNWSARFFKSVPYHVKSDGYIDLAEVRTLAIENKPKLIWCGATAYPREIPFEELSKICPRNPALVAKMLTLWRRDIAAKMKMDFGVVEEKINNDKLGVLLKEIKKGKLSPNLIKPIFNDLMKGVLLEDILARESGENDEIEEKILKIIKEKPGLSEKAYMGIVMKEFMGKISGKDAMEIIKKHIS